MRPTEFDELAFFRAIHASGARALLIGRRAPVLFEELWQGRRSIALAPDVDVQIPAIDGLILTKQIGARPRDLEDIRLLRIRQEEEGP